MPDPTTQRAANEFVDELLALIAQFWTRNGQRWISVGTIQPDYSLFIHEDGSVFPAGQYAGPDVYAAQRVTANDPVTDPGVVDTTSATAVGDHGTHTHTLIHDHLLPITLRALAPGDRVLVAWLEGENDPIVVHRLVPIVAPA